MNGYLIGVLGGVFLSIDSIVIKLMGINDSWLIVVLRGLLMWLTLLIAYWIVPKYRDLIGVPWVTKKNRLSVLCFCGASIGFVNAINLGSIATVLVIISATPFVSIIILRVFFREPVDYSSIIASIAGMIGVAIVMQEGSYEQMQLANLYAAVTAVFMALAFIFSARSGGGAIGLPALGGLLSAIFTLLVYGADLLPLLDSLSHTQWKWALLEGMLIMPLALGLLAFSTRFVPPSVTGLFLLLETGLAPLWAFLFLNQVPSFHVIVGGVLITSTIIVKFIFDERQTRLVRS